MSGILDRTPQTTTSSHKDGVIKPKKEDIDIVVSSLSCHSTPLTYILLSQFPYLSRSLNSRFLAITLKRSYKTTRAISLTRSLHWSITHSIDSAFSPYFAEPPIHWFGNTLLLASYL